MIEANDLPKQLVEFLTEQDILQQYLDNCNVDVVRTFDGLEQNWINTMELTKLHDYIVLSFVFSSTDEGGDYWFEVSQQFKEYINAR